MNENEKNNPQVDEPTESHEQTPIDECQEWKDKYLHVVADFDNFRRRMTRDQASWTDNAQDRVFLALLPIIDNFDRAFNERKEAQESGDLKSWADGIAIIHGEFKKLLEQFGIKRMDNYKMFDPQYHDALTQIASDDHESGAIVDVMEHGYMRNDKVLRPAKVVVAQ